LNKKKYREQNQLFLIEGARAVQQVLVNKAISVEKLFFDLQQQYWTQEEWKSRTGEVESFTLSEELFAEVSDTDTPQGVLAMCRMPSEISISELATREGIIVAFDAVQDPGNLGTIIRTASWFGAEALLSGKGTVDLFHPKVVRGTAGATGGIPHINGSLVEMLPDFEASDWSVYFLDTGPEAVSISQMSPTAKAIIVVGNEAHGVNTKLMSEERKKVRIPSPESKPAVESLNAAIATSIALYDFSTIKG
jgi:TrmH family RNA methyltransferase